MRINEVEKLVGISKANIRYYEKMGLLKASRTEGNNYRDYSSDDIKTLKRIKTLRMLDVSIAEIAKLNNDEVSLETIAARHRKALEAKEKELKNIKETLDAIISKNIDYEDVDESILVKSSQQSFWTDRLREVLQKDITEIEVSGSGLNKSIGVMVICGLILNIVIAFIFGNWLLRYEGTTGVSAIDSSNGSLNVTALFVICIVVGLASYYLMYFTSNKVLLFAVYLVNTILLSPLIACIYKFASDIAHTGMEVHNTQFSNGYFALMWVFILIYMIVIYMLSLSKKDFFSSVKNTLVITVGYIFAAACVMSLAMGFELTVICITAIIILYFGLSWYHVYNDRSEYTSYYAILQAIRVMNLVGVFFTMRGRQTLKGRRYDG